MTRRERLENKLEKREQWAQSRDAESSRRYEAASSIAKNIPFGQPILLGHHSEKRARGLQAQIHSNSAASVENAKMAEYHREKAEGLVSYLDGTIFDDDPDAIEREIKIICQKITQQQNQKTEEK